MAENTKYTLGVKERLKLRKDIETLFQNGKAFSSFPVRVIFSFEETEDCGPIKVGFSIPKKKINKANKRNRLRRRLRESWRLNKHLCVSNKGYRIHLFLIYTSSDMHSFSEINDAVIRAIALLNSKIENFKGQ